MRIGAMQVFCQTGIRILYVRFKFIAEMPYCTAYRPGGCITQRANRLAFDVLCHVDQEVDVAHFSMAVFDAMQHFCHPARAFPARAALATGLVVIKPGEIPKIADDAGAVVENDESAGAQHGTTYKATLCK